MQNYGMDSLVNIIISTNNQTELKTFVSEPVVEDII
jgi:hypothetical protein